MNIDNLSLVEVADVLDAWSETEERKAPYLKVAEKKHARNCAVNFAWLRDQIRNRIQDTLWREIMKPETQKLVSARLRVELEERLSRMLRIDPAELPPLSLSDIVSLIFTLHGDTNSLASAGGTSSAIIKLIGRERFWETPAEQPESEPIAPTVN